MCAAINIHFSHSDLRDCFDKLIHLIFSILLLQQKYKFFLVGAHNQRISATGTDRFGICVLLCSHSGHPVYCHVVPSFWNFGSHLSFYRTELLLHQEGINKQKNISDLLVYMKNMTMPVTILY